MMKLQTMFTSKFVESIQHGDEHFASLIIFVVQAAQPILNGVAQVCQIVFVLGLLGGILLHRSRESLFGSIDQHVSETRWIDVGEGFVGKSDFDQRTNVLGRAGFQDSTESERVRERVREREREMETLTL
jgi:hypothetical protein